MHKAVFLDRDGVINIAIVLDGKPYPPANLSELIIPDEVNPALQRLKEADFTLIVVTNQPDVARGTQTRLQVEEINRVLHHQLPLTALLVCYHDSSYNCDCRKPKPGLILQAAHSYAIDLSLSYMIGDRWKDIEAGQRAGCSTIFIDYHYTEQLPKNPTHTVSSLTEAVSIILEQTSPLPFREGAGG